MIVILLILLNYFQNYNPKVAGYIINGDSVEFAQVQAQSVAQKLKQYSNLFQEHQIKTFLALLKNNRQFIKLQKEQSSGSTLAEKVLAVLAGVQCELEASLENLKQNKINTSWELTVWVSLNEAEIANLKEEYIRKQVFANRTATQIQAALTQQTKSMIILQQQQDSLDLAQVDLEVKRVDYPEAKAKRYEENAILVVVIIMFKKQVASWSGR